MATIGGLLHERRLYEREEDARPSGDLISLIDLLRSDQSQDELDRQPIQPDNAPAADELLHRLGWEPVWVYPTTTKGFVHYDLAVGYENWVPISWQLEEYQAGSAEEGNLFLELEKFFPGTDKRSFHGERREHSNRFGISITMPNVDETPLTLGDLRRVLLATQAFVDADLFFSDEESQDHYDPGGGPAPWAGGHSANMTT